MALYFPNNSHRFDSTNNKINFMAFDGSQEVHFSIGVVTIEDIGKSVGMSSQQLLKFFSDSISLIHPIAERIYSDYMKPNQVFHYTLTSDDF